MTPQANTDSRNVDKDFEALWARAINFEQDVSKASGSGTVTSLNDVMTPDRVIEWITDLAERSHAEGLIDDAQLGEIRQCSHMQQSIFRAIDASRLRAVTASFQND